jgi:hypothetical protein
MKKKKNQVTSWHIGVAAEAIAAGTFARCGFDVSIQYGANQPEYDLLVAKGDEILKVSVKGSQDGEWGLVQSYLPKRRTEEKGRKPDYHAAIDLWRKAHGRKTIFCFVQFHQVSLDQLPRIYLASPAEIAKRLHETAKGRGDTILYQEKVWTNRAWAAGTTDKIPSTWNFSEKRVMQFFSAARVR